ncbi:hypothetical protein ACFQFC_08920 [Amorphoplanes digitatis]|uniref:Uncharacterized protein n=1 Tax=Actinoplanes digitatis TaxID=1868 RepID=A0A7W7MRJ9_9ACTN|nr:hypothetical protein [Actinoplanes digitatis]MBB4764331.1 hypothetical protein [Actinoplanes digitatis]GID94183.1 hypothetical protein Adi01nite_35950 [Actinoplanes digitatis]
MTGVHDLKGLLEQATSHEPPPGAGPAEVFGRARSMQRRRRVGAGVAGAATLGVLLVVAVAARPGPAAGPDPEGGVAPAAPAPSTGAPSPGTPATVLETLRTLLPPGAKTRDHESDDGFAGLVITDPAGRTTVEVNVQPHFTELGKASAAQLLDRYDCAKRTDPDGTECTATSTGGVRIVSIDGPAEEPSPAGVVRRQVDVLGPDGLRVVVTAWNAVEVKDGPATRSAPALTGAELREIATSERWSPAPTGQGNPQGAPK